MLTEFVKEGKPDLNRLKNFNSSGPTSERQSMCSKLNRESKYSAASVSTNANESSTNSKHTLKQTRKEEETKAIDIISPEIDDEEEIPIINANS